METMDPLQVCHLCVQYMRPDCSIAETLAAASWSWEGLQVQRIVKFIINIIIMDSWRSLHGVHCLSAV